jgi:transcription-repair coupling factor (superfamily II helicase)
LTGLNTNEWERKLKKANKDAEEIAEELLEVFAERKLGKAFEFIANQEKESTFRNSFPYIYTEDQEKTINEVLANMGKNTPMDMLVV